MIRSLAKTIRKNAYSILESPSKQREFIRNTPKLNSVQQQLLNDIKRDGVAKVNADALISKEILERLRNEFDEFQALDKIKEALKNHDTSAINKDHLYKQFNLRASSLKSYDFKSAIMQLGFDGIIGDIASHYFNEQAILRYTDYWLSLPVEGSERSNSQQWHRDPEDQKIFKVFIYLNDVSKENGAFEYIKGSHVEGPYNEIFPYDDVHKNNYPSEKELKELIPSDAFTTCEVPAYTLVICDTHGFHRGGYCINDNRELMTLMYNKCSLNISNQFKSGDRSILNKSQKRFHAFFA